jgi:hypothetical protein
VASKTGDVIEVFGVLAPELERAIDRTVAGDMRSSSKL